MPPMYGFYGKPAIKLNLLNNANAGSTRTLDELRKKMEKINYDAECVFFSLLFSLFRRNGFFALGL